MKSDRYKKSDSKRTHRGRYWDLMLVGDQGQVVPFRRFKNLAIVVLGALAISLIAAAVLGVMFASGRVKLKSLERSLAEIQQQLAQLRDEKDLLLTQVVIKKKQSGTTSSPKVPGNKSDAVSKELTGTTGKTTTAAPKSSKPEPKADKKATPEKPEAILSADARRIKASYQPERQLLSLTFRIYNTSKPKVPLSGRTVVVFKNQDDPPIKWRVVPRVQLVDGKPSGKRGKAFKINNYRTEKFKAYNQKLPVTYNLATIFIYASNGELLLTKEHRFKIDVKPSPKPIIPAPKPVKVIPKPQPDPVAKPVEPPVPSPISSPSAAPGAATSEAAAESDTSTGIPDATDTNKLDSVPSIPTETPPTDQPAVSPATEPSPKPNRPITNDAQYNNDAATTAGEPTSPLNTQGEKP